MRYRGLIQIDGLDVYVTEPLEGKFSGKAVLFLTDAFGIDFREWCIIFIFLSTNILQQTINFSLMNTHT